jgi:putative oxidoreductase
MLKKFFQTNDAIVALVLRLVLGVIFFPHGMQKLFGWFGGYGFSGSLGWFTGTMGIPALFAVLVILAEGLGSLGLLTGFLTRLSALGIALTMIGAILMVHLPNGFFMNWDGKKAGEGYEFHLLAIGISVALVISGGGKWSIDRIIAGKMK